jgi:hypothetical protein
MSRLPGVLAVALVLALLQSQTEAGYSGRIAFVTDNTPTDTSWTDLLTANGWLAMRNVTTLQATSPATLTPAQSSFLNGCDLVIMSSGIGPIAKYGGTNLGFSWNALTVPILLVSCLLELARIWCSLQHVQMKTGLMTVALSGGQDWTTTLGGNSGADTTQAKSYPVPPFTASDALFANTTFNGNGGMLWNLASTVVGVKASPFGSRAFRFLNVTNTAFGVVGAYWNAGHSSGVVGAVFGGRRMYLALAPDAAQMSAGAGQVFLNAVNFLVPGMCR